MAEATPVKEFASLSDISLHPSAPTNRYLYYVVVDNARTCRRCDIQIPSFSGGLCGDFIFVISHSNPHCTPCLQWEFVSQL